MKKVVFSLVVIYVFSGVLFSQVKKERLERGDSKIERLEKIKLIEALELNEETTLRFFSRRAEHRKTMQSLQDAADNKIIELEKALQNPNIQDSELKKILSEYQSLEQKMANERASFINSLNDLLDQKQLSRLIVFERRFKQELRDVILRERQRKRN